MPYVGPREITELSKRFNSPLCRLFLSPIPSLPCSAMHQQCRPSFLHQRTEAFEDLSSVVVDLPPGEGLNSDKGRRIDHLDEPTPYRDCSIRLPFWIVLVSLAQCLKG